MQYYCLKTMLFVSFILKTKVFHRLQVGYYKNRLYYILIEIYS